MKRVRRVCVFLVPILVLPFAHASQILLRYVDIGNGGSAQALAADKTGNLFSASTTINDSGRGVIRVSKLDATGHRLATFDFPCSGGPTAATTDAQGNLIIVGVANSTGFPAVSPLFPSVTGRSAFITKIDSQLHGIIFSTLVIDQSSAAAVALDSAGNIYVAGSTTSTSFPVTSGAYHTQAPGAFLIEMSPIGDRLLYATQFGGSQVSCFGGSRCIGVTAMTFATALVIDPSGAIVFAGNTTALDLPATPGVLGPKCQCSYTNTSGFLAKLAPGGGQLAWSTFINPTSELAGYILGVTVNALALDPAGNILIGGGTLGIQTTPGTVQPAPPPDAYQGFIAKLSASATQFIWSTYMGGGIVGRGPYRGATSLAVHPDGRIAFTGYSDPSLLPAFPGVTNLGDTYAGWLSADGATLQALYVGPNNSTGQALTLEPSGNLVTLGQAGSLWIEIAGTGPSALATASAAGGPVSGQAAPYELVSIYGLGVGPQTALSGEIANGAFTSSLGGYQVLFDSIPAPLLYVGPTQINTIVPSELAGQDFTHLQIVTPAGTVDGPTLALRQAHPYLFQNGATGLSAALNQDGRLNSPENPATAGSIVTVFATGGGARGWGDGEIVPINLNHFAAGVSVLKDHANSLEVLYAGDAPGLVAGVMQINFRLPASLSILKTFSFQLEVKDVLGGSGAIAVAP